MIGNINGTVIEAIIAITTESITLNFFNFLFEVPTESNGKIYLKITFGSICRTENI